MILDFKCDFISKQISILAVEDNRFLFSVSKSCFPEITIPQYDENFVLWMIITRYYDCVNYYSYLYKKVDESLLTKYIIDDFSLVDKEFIKNTNEFNRHMIENYEKYHK